jgi:hypothetical protein
MAAERVRHSERKEIVVVMKGGLMENSVESYVKCLKKREQHGYGVANIQMRM